MQDHPVFNARHFVNVLAHLEHLLEADIIAWDEQSSVEAQERLDRLTTALKRAAEKLRDAL